MVCWSHCATYKNTHTRRRCRRRRLRRLRSQKYVHTRNYELSKRQTHFVAIDGRMH